MLSRLIMVSIPRRQRRRARRQASPQRLNPQARLARDISSRHWRPAASTLTGDHSLDFSTLLFDLAFDLVAFSFFEDVVHDDAVGRAGGSAAVAEDFGG